MPKEKNAANLDEINVVAMHEKVTNLGYQYLYHSIFNDQLQHYNNNNKTKINSVSIVHYSIAYSLICLVFLSCLVPRHDDFK